MKIWQNMTLGSPTGMDADNAVNRNNAGKSTVWTYQIPAMTIFHKKADVLSIIGQQLSQSPRSDFQSVGFWVKGKPVAGAELVRKLQANPEIKPHISLYIRDITDLDYKKSEELNDKDTNNLLNTGPDTFLLINRSVNPRDFEQIFHVVSLNGFAGVAFDVESFRRGHIVLAHKFNLDTMITGIIHERHEKLALSSNANHLIIG